MHIHGNGYTLSTLHHPACMVWETFRMPKEVWCLAASGLPRTANTCTQALANGEGRMLDGLLALTIARAHKEALARYLNTLSYPIRRRSPPSSWTTPTPAARSTHSSFPPSQHALVRGDSLLPDLPLAHAHAHAELGEVSVEV